MDKTFQEKMAEVSTHPVAIRIDHLSKLYKLYDKPSDRMKEALGFSRKKRYTEHYALKDVSFNVYKGETVGIIGTNGSGKSTILKIITGVLNATEGTVEVAGRISALLELGAGFNQEYSGLENVYLNGTMIGFSRAEIDAKLNDILSFADIGDFIYQPVKTYSSGMFVRLAFAVAINIEPEILIVDEALSVGDVFFQSKCFHKFEEFKKEGRTILFVSHDLSSVSKYCDRVILLNQGVKLDEGSPRDMVDLYKKLIVGLGDGVRTGADGRISEEAQAIASEKVTVTEGGKYKNLIIDGGLLKNPDTIEYGEFQALIYRLAVYDEQDNVTNALEKGAVFKIRMWVHFLHHVEAPICAYSFKNVLGTEITGTNTMYEKKDLPAMEDGDECCVTFTQKMDLQGGEYLLSFGCTGFHEGDFRVFHRLYDVLNITVISTKNTVGYYDMNSEVDEIITRKGN